MTRNVHYWKVRIFFGGGKLTRDEKNTKKKKNALKDQENKRSLSERKLSAKVWTFALQFTYPLIPPELLISETFA